MKAKQKVDLITGIMLFLLASTLLLFPRLNITSLRVSLMVIFGGYTMIKLGEFILTYKEKDYQSLFTSIISLIAFLCSMFLELKVKNLALILLVWMALMCLIKLKKADYYHDRHNKMWILRIGILMIFLTSGLLTGFHLAYESSIQIIVIGYFFLINSILEIIDPIVVSLLGE